MEIKTKYNVGDKVWIMRNNKPEKIQISNIEVEVIGDVNIGGYACNLGTQLCAFPMPDMAGSHITRSEERRVGKECLRLCRSRWSPYH